jgi:hypothetical protein
MNARAINNMGTFFIIMLLIKRSDRLIFKIPGNSLYEIIDQ